MAQYRFTGPAPDYIPGESGLLIVHPGDVWEFPEGPVLGHWEPVSEPEGSEKPSEAPEGATQTSAPGDSENPPTDESGPSSTPES